MKNDLTRGDASGRWRRAVKYTARSTFCAIVLLGAAQQGILVLGGCGNSVPNYPGLDSGLANGGRSGGVGVGAGVGGSSSSCVQPGQACNSDHACCTGTCDSASGTCPAACGEAGAACGPCGATCCAGLECSLVDGTCGTHTYKLLTYSLLSVMAGTPMQVGEYDFTATDGVPTALTAGGFVNVITQDPPQLVTIQLAQAGGGMYSETVALRTGVTSNEGQMVPYTIDLEDVLPSPPSPPNAPDSDAGSEFDPTYAAIGHVGSVALHYVGSNSVAYEVDFPSMSAKASSVAVEQDLGYNTTQPPQCTGPITSGNATVATTSSACPPNLDDNQLLYVDFFNQNTPTKGLYPGSPVMLNAMYSGLGTPKGVTTSEIATEAWLISNDATNTGHLSSWGIPGLGLIAQTKFLGTAVAVDGGQFDGLQGIAVAVDGAPSTIQWFEGGAVNAPPLSQNLPGSPQQLRMALGTTWVAIKSPAKILGYMGNVPSGSPLSISLPAGGQPIDFVVVAPTLCMNVPGGSIDAFVHMLVEM